MSNNATRTDRFVQNTLATAAYMFAAWIMGFVTPHIMMTHYGSSVNGLIVTVTDILSYFKTVEVGLAAAAYAALYKPLAERNTERISAVVSAARIFYNAAGWFFMGATLIFGILYPLAVPVYAADGLQMEKFSVLLLILAMGVSGSLEFFTLARYRVLLAADQRTFAVSLASMASLLVQTLVLVILPAIGVDVILVRLLASLTILVRTVLLKAYFHKHYPQVNPLAAPDKSALSSKWDALLSECTSVFQNAAALGIGTVILRQSAIMSVYGAYHMVTTGLWSVLKMVTTGLNSIFGNLRVTDGEKAFSRTFSDFESLYHTCSAVLFSTAAMLIVSFVDLYGRDMMDANYHVPLLGLLIIAEAVTNHAKMPFEVMIQSTGRFRDVKIHCILEMAVTLVSGTLLCLVGISLPEETLSRLGLLSSVEAGICGAVTGVCLGNLFRVVCQLTLVPPKITHTPVGESILRILRMIFSVVLCTLPGYYLLKKFPPSSFLKWGLMAIPCALFALAVCLGLAFLMDRRATLSLFSRGKRFLLRKLGKEQA